MQDLCKVKHLLEVKQIAEDTIDTMERYAKLYNSEGMISNFKLQFEDFQTKLLELNESINDAIKADDFTRYEELRRDARKFQREVHNSRVFIDFCREKVMRSITTPYSPPSQLSIESSDEFCKSLTNDKHLITDNLHQKHTKDMHEFEISCRKEVVEEVKQKIQQMEEQLQKSQQEIVIKNAEVESMQLELAHANSCNEKLWEEIKKMTFEIEELEEADRSKPIVSSFDLILYFQRSAKLFIKRSAKLFIKRRLGPAMTLVMT